MALIPCAQCRQPFYASCHDGACCDALCPYCEYAEMPAPAPIDGAARPNEGADGEAVGRSRPLATQPASYRR